MLFRLKCGCGERTESEKPIDVCPSCGKNQSRMEYDTMGRGPVLKGRTRHVSEAVQKSFAISKKRWNAERHRIRNGSLELHIPAGAPDAPDFERTLH